MFGSGDVFDNFSERSIISVDVESNVTLESCFSGSLNVPIVIVGGIRYDTDVIYYGRPSGHGRKMHGRSRRAHA